MATFHNRSVYMTQTDVDNWVSIKRHRPKESLSGFLQRALAKEAEKLPKNKQPKKKEEERP